METEFDRRGARYTEANQTMPNVRANEIRVMLKKINAQLGDVILDFGCGSGVITIPLSQQIGHTGKIIAADSTDAFLKELTAPNIKPVLSDPEKIQLENKSVDGVVSLASLHHIPDKQLAFNEFYRILKSGGRLVVGDVAHGTKVQQYFDGPVDQFCSTGHKHKFLNKRWAQELCSNSGLELVEWKLEDVPWVFKNEKQAAWFLHTIHDATCTPEVCLSEAKEYLGFKKEVGKFILNWQLFYMVARKK